MLQEEMLEQSNQTIYTDMAKQEVHGCFCSPIQSPGCRENIEYATFSTQPSDCGQWGLFQRERPSDSLFKKKVVTLGSGVMWDVRDSTLSCSR